MAFVRQFFFLQHQESRLSYLDESVLSLKPPLIFFTRFSVEVKLLQSTTVGLANLTTTVKLHHHLWKKCAACRTIQNPTNVTRFPNYEMWDMFFKGPQNLGRRTHASVSVNHFF